MPKDNRNKRPASSSRSTRSSKSRSSTHSADTCRDNKCKDLICQERIAVKVAVTPEVRCTKSCDNKGQLKVAVKAFTDTDCKVKSVKSRTISPCETECIYNIEFSTHTTFEPRILSQCEIPAANALLEFRAKAEQKC